MGFKATSIDDLLAGTFFDWDSAHYDIRKRKLRVQDGYLERINSRTLGVNLIVTPSSIGNAVRAVRRVMLWDLRISLPLLEFVDDVLVHNGIEALAAYENRKFGQSVCALYRHSQSLIDALSSGNRSSHSIFGSPRQMELLGIR